MVTTATERRRATLGASLGREPEFFRRLRAHGFRWLQVADAMALFASMVIINVVRFGFAWPSYSTAHYLVGFAVATGIGLVVYYFAGLYERENRLGYRPW